MEAETKLLVFPKVWEKKKMKFIEKKKKKIIFENVKSSYRESIADLFSSHFYLAIWLEIANILTTVQGKNKILAQLWHNSHLES